MLHAVESILFKLHGYSNSKLTSFITESSIGTFYVKSQSNHIIICVIKCIYDLKYKKIQIELKQT